MLDAMRVACRIRRRPSAPMTRRPAFTVQTADGKAVEGRLRELGPIGPFTSRRRSPWTAPTC